jgi:hypothetical protein
MGGIETAGVYPQESAISKITMELKMSEEKQRKPRTPKNIDQEILFFTEKLRIAREKKAKLERANLEKNRKAILAVLIECGLDQVTAEEFKQKAEQLRTLFSVKSVLPVAAQQLASNAQQPAHV